MYKLLFLLLLLPASAFSQKDSSKYNKDTVAYTPVPIDTTGAIVFRRVFDMPNTPKSELYARAKVWTALTFHTTQDVVTFDDLDKTNLIINGVREGDNYLWFTILFTFKDNRYRVIISQFKLERWDVAGHPLPGGASSKDLAIYYPDKDYKELLQYNINVKAGEDRFNAAAGLNMHHENEIASRLQLIGDFAGAEFQEIQKAMQRSAKGDDF